MDNLWKALSRWVAAKQEHDKAYAEYEGYSWDWAGHYLIKEVEEARAEAEQALNKIIDERIELNLAKQGS